MLTSHRYREFLIECLKDAEHAAGYIEAILEAENTKPKLLQNALKKVVEAYARNNQLSDRPNNIMKNSIRCVQKAEVQKFTLW